jgi:hypothetical protein
MVGNFEIMKYLVDKGADINNVVSKNELNNEYIYTHYYHMKYKNYLTLNRK